MPSQSTITKKAAKTNAAPKQMTRKVSGRTAADTPTRPRKRQRRPTMADRMRAAVVAVENMCSRVKDPIDSVVDLPVVAPSNDTPVMTTAMITALPSRGDVLRSRNPVAFYRYAAGPSQPTYYVCGAIELPDEIMLTVWVEEDGYFLGPDDMTLTGLRAQLNHRLDPQFVPRTLSRVMPRPRSALRPHGDLTRDP